MTEVSLQTLLDTGAHFGHQIRRWNPKMKPFIYQGEDGVHIFDLLKTKEALEEALGIIKEAAKEGKSLLIVGTKKQVREKVAQIAKETNILYVNERWLGGTLTNFDQVKKSLDKLIKMKKDKEEGVYKNFTKKERLLIDREIVRLERFFGGLTGMSVKPDLMIIIDIKKEIGAAKEANFTGITTVGIVDSNADPDLVDYAIPMNDDAKKALDYVLDLIKDAILEGKSKPQKKVPESK
ncbi:30S ribosomal protein S2 [Candidatus Woesebacteria bacterium RBG_16_36_11]|uniref:Small ribosomal subunit protein uS2 n=3 Tax=Candidatus Woeseibacteriota TaxID=1752722 RepID=A0A1F7XBR4_9BACT|nr:MAG: 30S ribosomal protein S2 [Candidatus Woesebacteria bacterium RBG_13_36_22]OGM12462.1 MAG: 30S ribosomal protein S2 [Candidatus Woesebacteria bacterium RBG_16_36_11]OGM15641.1 MAG: 30S ribosomal protein S2 [Candidatus Woesebacteria bacterium RBG_19FT_COMBO_37_29]